MELTKELISVCIGKKQGLAMNALAEAADVELMKAMVVFRDAAKAGDLVITNGVVASWTLDTDTESGSAAVEEDASPTVNVKESGESGDREVVNPAVESVVAVKKPVGESGVQEFALEMPDTEPAKAVVEDPEPHTEAVVPPSPPVAFDPHPDGSLCVLPEGTPKAAEFFKTLRWILSRDHDLHGNVEMATKRAYAARNYHVIDDTQFLKALDIVETHARARKEASGSHASEGAVVA